MSFCCSGELDVVLKPIDAVFRAYFTIKKPVACLRIMFILMHRHGYRIYMQYCFTQLPVKNLSISTWYLSSIYHQVKVIIMSCCCSRAIDVVMKPIDALFLAYLTIMKPVTCLRIQLLKWPLMSQVEQKQLTLPEFTPGFWLDSCCSTSPIYGFWLPLWHLQTLLQFFSFQHSYLSLLCFLFISVIIIYVCPSFFEFRPLITNLYVQTF